MNRDVLEQLLIDQAMNELSPRTAVLLDAYLSDHPELQPLADSIQKTVELGKKAVHADLPMTLPPLSKEKLLQHRRVSFRSSMIRWGSVAASLVIGFSLGMSTLLLRGGQSQPYPDTMTVGVQTQPVAGGLETARTFWSSKTYIDRYQRTLKKRNPKNEGTNLQNQIQKIKKRGLL